MLYQEEELEELEDFRESNYVMTECLRLSPVHIKTKEEGTILESESAIEIDFETFITNKFAIVQNNREFFCYFIDLKEKLRVIKVTETEVENLMILNDNMFK